MHLVRKHAFQPKDGSFFSTECGSLIQSWGVQDLSALDIRFDWYQILGLAARNDFGRDIVSRIAQLSSCQFVRRGSVRCDGVFTRRDPVGESGC